MTSNSLIRVGKSLGSDVGNRVDIIEISDQISSNLGVAVPTDSCERLRHVSTCVRFVIAAI